MEEDIQSRAVLVREWCPQLFDSGSKMLLALHRLRYLPPRCTRHILNYFGMADRL